MEGNNTWSSTIYLLSLILSILWQGLVSLPPSNFTLKNLNPPHYYPSDPLSSDTNDESKTVFFPHIRAYSASKAQWLWGLILALLCPSWSGAFGFPALLHAVLMLSSAGIPLRLLLCFPPQTKNSFPYVVLSESPSADAQRFTSTFLVNYAN